ncbi:alanine racemase [Campylobacter suis]|uniref:Alanine racemase n=1 Tax=Campylobacter suis TaxID=2790657 RepID=A0ABN7K9G2_9BACT|nr:alanine racemase [Campylobacter suis]CAD7289111.1 Alanine racemase [Campylobacter suis]
MAEIRLNKKNYEHNLRVISKKASGRVILVLKSNAYGHGAKLLAKTASELGFKFCAVKNEQEAYELTQYMQEILILSHIFNGSEKDDFIYAVNSLDDLKTAKSGTKIHLKIDTLMHRNGIDLSEIDTALKIIKERNLQLLGAFTHFRSADEMNADYFVQKQNFMLVKARIKEQTDSKDELVFHSHASAAFERNLSGFDDEYVRVGMAQLGYAQFDKNLELKPVLSLWARRISARTLKATQGVGYGAKFIAQKDMAVATYDIGYGGGLLRYGGQGELLLANKKPMLGKMSMDSFSCEDVGEWVCVFDDARSWAKFFNTIEYEILVKLSPFIDRKWV